MLLQLADALPAVIEVCIIANRGFGDQNLYRVLSEQLSFDYVIRFRGNIHVASAKGKPAPLLPGLTPVGAPKCCVAPR